MRRESYDPVGPAIANSAVIVFILKRIKETTGTICELSVVFIDCISILLIIDG